MHAQNKNLITKEIIYKTSEHKKLKLHYYSNTTTKTKPTIVFFHPGGWFSGTPLFFEEHAKYYALKNFNAISVTYTLANFTTTTPQNCVEDAKDALIYLKLNAKKLFIDLDKLYLFGYSAGGHIALMTQLTTSKTIPKANKIFCIASPVALEEDAMLKTTNMSYQDKVQLSPLHNLNYLESKLFLFNGTKDAYISYKSIVTFKNKALDLHKTINLKTFKNAGHFLLASHRKEIESAIELEITKN